MRAVVQRVDSAAVEVEGAMVGSVGKGLLVLLGVEKEDTDRDLEYLLDKVAGLRIFEDEQEKMHIVLRDVRTARYKVSDFVFNPEEKKFIGSDVLDGEGINYRQVREFTPERYREKDGIRGKALHRIKPLCSHDFLIAVHF